VAATVALLAASPASASPVLVLGADGHVRVREDRFLPPADPQPAVAATAAAPARAAAARRKGPTVRAELTRLEAEGALPPETVTGYRDAYTQARTTLKQLGGYRRAQLQAVLDNVEAAAAGGLFLPSRLPALFLTLQRNRAWWAAAPIPAAGARMTFAGSRIVWQHYPGQGLQIQWLATFGKANGLWMAKDHDEDLRALLDEALGLATLRAGGIAFEYLFVFDGGRPPWVSGLAQGTALSALSRAAVRLADPRYADAARNALGIFRTPPPAGVRVPTAAGAHYLQYSYAPKLRIVNGFTQALNGLHDFAAINNDAEGHALFDAGEAELRAELPTFDTGAWSLYSRVGAAGPESDLGYHKLLRDFLRGLCERMTADRERAAAQPAPSTTTPAATGGTAAPAPAAVLADPALYCDTAQRFTTDLKTPPRLALPDGQKLRAKATGAIRFTLDKVAVVTVTVLRDGAVVLSRTARIGRGSHETALKPAKAGPLEVRLRAVDLAGNAAAAAGSLSVRPAAKRHKSN
jgi:hypothetical protein